MKHLRSIIGVASVLTLANVPFLSKGDSPSSADPRQVEVNNVIIAVSGAELDISPVRVSKTAKWTMNFLSPISIDQRKENLKRALCRETGADIIVDPQFTYTKRVFDGGKLTLTGYPAKYRNFRSLTETEIDSLVLKKNQPENTIIFYNR